MYLILLWIVLSFLGIEPLARMTQPLPHIAPDCAPAVLFVRMAFLGSTCGGLNFVRTWSGFQAVLDQNLSRSRTSLASHYPGSFTTPMPHSSRMLQATYQHCLVSTTLLPCVLVLIINDCCRLPAPPQHVCCCPIYAALHKPRGTLLQGCCWQPQLLSCHNGSTLPRLLTEYRSRAD